MNVTYIKLYRSLLDNPIWKDKNATRILTYLLLKVDYKSGTIDTSSYEIGKMTGISASTVRSSLARLQAAHILLTKSLTNSTEISLLNWDKYQSSNSDPLTTTSQGLKKAARPRYIQEERIKNIDISKDISVDAEAKLGKPVSTTPKVATELQLTVLHLEETLKTKIANFGKQAKAYTMLMRADYTPEQIRRAITYMATRDDFWRDKGFDLMNVVNYMPMLKARERNLS